MSDYQGMSSAEIFGLPELCQVADELENSFDEPPWSTEQKKRKRILSLESSESDSKKDQVSASEEEICSEHPITGAIYEIDHPHIPASLASSQLASVRVVEVSEVSEEGVKIRFPSAESLREFLKKDAEKTDQAEDTKPELDEELSITIEDAERMLVREISSAELLDQGSDSFWLAEDDKGHVINTVTSSPRRWGVRRKSRKRSRVAKDKDNLQLLISKLEIPEPDSDKNDTVPLLLGNEMKVKLEPPAEDSDANDTVPLRLRNDMKGRWSTGRYENAQLRLIEILHEKAGKPGQPVSRNVLRAEARKHIGDTGLLDHLLKHMVDKTIGDGQRFRRRHNSEGGMEYWLEDATLMEARKSAGVEDPFWLPPPGWKPGNNHICTCRSGMTSAEIAEMERLKQEIEDLKREVRSSKASPTETESLTKNSQQFWQDSELKGKMRNEVEDLRASIEELQGAYIHLHDFHLENKFLYRAPLDYVCESVAVNTNSCMSCIQERMHKLEVQLNEMVKEYKEEKLNMETRYAKMWKLVSSLQEAGLVQPPCDEPLVKMEQEIYNLDKEIGWLGVLPPLISLQCI